MEPFVDMGSNAINPTISEDVYATLHAASRLSFYTFGQVARAVSKMSPNTRGNRLSKQERDT